ncbi:MAG: hypothetical protein AAF357_04980, partial [Verrucomicrobiota bacterium]
MSGFRDRSEVGIGRYRSIRGEVLAFLIFISLPILFWGFDRSREYAVQWQGDSLREKLSSFETSFARLPVFEFLRDADQRFLTSALEVGNSRVVVGENGWLHYRADLDAVVGKGPFYKEPDSVARAPGLKPWNCPVPVIRDFVRQLEERGIELVLVPVPTKAMAVSVDGESREMAPAYYDELLGDLQEIGVEVIDLMPLLSQPGSYLRQDTHWTPAAMEKSAFMVAEHLGGVEKLSLAIKSVNEVMSGDLVSMLFDDDLQTLYPRESVILNRVKGWNGGKLNASDPGASWVLLGDSFVNVFDDPTLGFLDLEDAGLLRAGFASHLAAQLGRPLHVIAINGSGATGVRKAFAELPDDVVRKKKKVIWVLSARDLLLAEIPGRRAGIAWERVEFSKRQEERPVVERELIFTATMGEKTPVGDPETVTYPSAIYSARFESVTVLQGEYEFDEAHVFLWAFRDKELEATSRLEVGK